MKCDCIPKLNAQLAEKGLYLDLALALSIDTGKTEMAIPVATARIRPRRGPKPPAVYASFCPWCGISLKPSDASEPVSVPEGQPDLSRAAQAPGSSPANAHVPEGRRTPPQ